MAQRVEVTAMALVTAVVWVRSLIQELAHDAECSQKKKKRNALHVNKFLGSEIMSNFGFLLCTFHYFPHLGQ